MGSEGATPVFRYTADDISTFRDVGNTRSHYSELDWFLHSQWDRAMTFGEVFRYDLSDITTRNIPGQFGFIAQRNTKRFSHRRTPADMRTLTQPFDPKLFNFNKVRKEEILFEIQRKRLPHEVNQEEEKQHYMIVNISPIEYGHVLFVPEPQSCLPQVMTESSLRMCLEIMALSGHSGLCMLSNSLLAYASVNHLHYHFLYINHPLLANKVGGRHIAGGCYELTGHPSRGFGFQMDTTAEDCGREIFKVISVFLDSGLPHNLVMLWGDPFRKDKGALTGQGSPRKDKGALTGQGKLDQDKGALTDQGSLDQDKGALTGQGSPRKDKGALTGQGSLDQDKGALAGQGSLDQDKGALAGQGSPRKDKGGLAGQGSPRKDKGVLAGQGSLDQDKGALAGQGSLDQDKGALTGQGSLIRILLIPRKPVYGLKQLYEASGVNPAFFAAACELVLGFIPMLDQAQYCTITEEEVLEVLHEKTLSKEDFESLKQRIKLVLET